MALPRIGLALGSGAGRGWAHIGIVRALERAGVQIDVVCGASIGALVGGVWLTGHLDALEHWARGLNRMRILRYLDITFANGGLIGGSRLARLLEDKLGETRIEELRLPFVAVATELLTGHEIWLNSGRLVDGLRASYALPGVFTPIDLDGRSLVDGALVNPVPVSVCRAYGARLVIAVNLNADIIGKVRGPERNGARNGDDESEPHRLSDSAVAALPKRLSTSFLGQLFGPATHPGLFNVMVSSLNILQDRVSRSRLAGDPPDVTIAPRLGHIGLLEFDRAEEAIAEGEAAAERALPLLREAVAILGS